MRLYEVVIIRPSDKKHKNYVWGYLTLAETKEDALEQVMSDFDLEDKSILSKEVRLWNARSAQYYLHVIPVKGD